MADIFFKPSHEDLADERKKALKGTTEEEWCNRCVNTLVRILRKDPVAYRQYGPYWWNLKKSVISRQPEAIHGDFIDDLWAEPQITAMKWTTFFPLFCMHSSL